ncbi:hypothetical protein [Psychroflexus montanilacus]|uniref:hypothetical protein n=1 Tax=Psychroflexus montanilacus TaxID=2873598 RepID=UPI001CCF73FB|nr:hypothetical protein [Psychroflexus montanilacus]MBZ9650609.1 hypothetical protein [Psychroflexus montanilacus]
MEQNRMTEAHLITCHGCFYFVVAIPMETDVVLPVFCCTLLMKTEYWNASILEYISYGNGCVGKG